MGLSEQVVELIGVSDAALTKAATQLAEKEAAERKAAELIPQAVQALVDNQRIRPDQAEKMAALLRNPTEVMTTLIKAAAHRSPAELAQEQTQRLGQPGGTKTASSLESPHVGARNHKGVKESDRRLFLGLGLAPPAE